MSDIWGKDLPSEGIKAKVNRKCHVSFFRLDGPAALDYLSVIYFIFRIGPGPGVGVHQESGATSRSRSRSNCIDSDSLNVSFESVIKFAYAGENLHALFGNNLCRYRL